MLLIITMQNIKQLPKSITRIEFRNVIKAVTWVLLVCHVRNSKVIGSRNKHKTLYYHWPNSISQLKRAPFITLWLKWLTLVHVLNLVLSITNICFLSLNNCYLRHTLASKIPSTTIKANISEVSPASDNAVAKHMDLGFSYCTTLIAR